MNIVKYLKDENDKITKVEWQVIPATPNDERGYEIEGQEGKWLTIVSTFAEDAGKNILSINPYTNPGLSKYTELTEEEYNEIQEQKRIEEEKIAAQQEKQNHIYDLKNSISYYEELIKKQSKILTAVKSGIIYEGDLELMTALHNFTEESLEQTKETLSNIKKELEELEPVDGK